MATAFALYCKGHTLQQVSDTLGIPLNTLKSACTRQRWVERRDDSNRATVDNLKVTLRDAAQEHILRSVELARKGYDTLFNFLDTKSLDMLAVKQSADAACAFEGIARRSLGLDSETNAKAGGHITLSISAPNTSASMPIAGVIDVGGQAQISEGAASKQKRK